MTGKYEQSELKPPSRCRRRWAQNLANSLRGGNRLILAILTIESFVLTKTGMSGVPVAVRARLLRDDAGCGTAGCRDGDVYGDAIAEVLVRGKTQARFMLLRG
jgi:hypothetical protein